MTEAQIAERRRVFADFIRRGLVVIDEQLPNGCAIFTWTQPDHPEVIAFNAAGEIFGSILPNHA